MYVISAAIFQASIVFVRLQLQGPLCIMIGRLCECGVVK